MDKQGYIDQLEDLNAQQLAEGIFKGIVTFEELRKTGEFDASKQKSVRTILRRKDDDAFASACTIAELERYLTVFADGNHVFEAHTKIQQIREEETARERKSDEREAMFRKIKEDINEYTPDEIINVLSDNDLRDLCDELGIDASTVREYEPPYLLPNVFPQEEDDVPQGYTDVFFWGIPSSGKTTALAAILSTIKKDYTMEASDTQKKFGATYRDRLINIFKNDIGGLPGRTNEDLTQYMPFLFSERGEKNKRKISFFELSGEMFKHFYDEVNDAETVDESKKEMIEQSFIALDLLLNSNNQKIHFFFIDYHQETKHLNSTGVSQSQYLEAAATYFRDRGNIFRKKTDAVYVVITKSDEIKGDDRVETGKVFLKENFGSFIDVLINQCKRNSVDFKVKLFSIGDVYFKRICKIDRSYSHDIIQDLLKRIRPISNNLLKTIFNS